MRRRRQTSEAPVPNSGEVGGSPPTPRHTHTHTHRDWRAIIPVQPGTNNQTPPGPQDTPHSVQTHNSQHPRHNRTPPRPTCTHTHSHSHTPPTDTHTRAYVHRHVHTQNRPENSASPANLETHQMSVPTGVYILLTP